MASRLGKSPILVATDLASRGLDVKDIKCPADRRPPLFLLLLNVGTFWRTEVLRTPKGCFCLNTTYKSNNKFENRHDQFLYVFVILVCLSTYITNFILFAGVVVSISSPKITIPGAWSTTISLIRSRTHWLFLCAFQLHHLSMSCLQFPTPSNVVDWDPWPRNIIKYHRLWFMNHDLFLRSCFAFFLNFRTKKSYETTVWFVRTMCTALGAPAELVHQAKKNVWETTCKTTVLYDCCYDKKDCRCPHPKSPKLHGWCFHICSTVWR